VGELAGNRAIEDAAIDYVLELERAAGRAPSDSRYQGAPGDVDSPPRVIEVKAFGGSSRSYGLLLEPRQIDEARRNVNFYLYVVENVRQGDPAKFTLKVLHGERLHGMLDRAVEHRYYEVPWPVADYDTTPRGL
jgi:hypothetical protein